MRLMGLLIFLSPLMAKGRGQRKNLRGAMQHNVREREALKQIKNIVPRGVPARLPRRASGGGRPPSSPISGAFGEERPARRGMTLVASPKRWSPSESEWANASSLT